jgi:CheY-like chemotaxis protein
MTAPILALPLSKLPDAPAAKRRVLLVDTSTTSRDLRAETMRKLGMDVDCAADISEARSWWRADLYNLVLLNVENELGHRDRFCADIRGATPPQQIAFLVGKPEYLADSPGADGTPGDKGSDQFPPGDVRAALSADISRGLQQRWGILEACRRISAVRSVSDARSKAVRERPAPPRDSELRLTRRTLDELLREEMQ